MSDHVDSVKEFVRLLERWRAAALDKGESGQVAIYDKRLNALNATVDELEELRRITKPIPASYGDLSDLPPELIKELSGIKVDDLEQQIFTIVKTGGKEVALDAVLIELYRRFDITQTRKFLQNKLWRMAQKELIFSVPGRKGVYSAIKPEGDAVSYDGFDSLLDPKPSAQTASSWDDDSDVPF